MAENNIDRAQELLDGVKEWKGLGGLTTTDIPLDNIQLYVRLSNQSSEPNSRAGVLFIPGGSIRPGPILVSLLNRSRTGGTS